MTRRYLGSRKNPYLKNVKISDEAKYQIDVVLDEARTKHAGSIKAKRGAFELDREKLITDSSEGMKPDSARFEIDLENDLNGADVTPKMLEDMSYSPSYRPNGKVGEQVSDITVSRLRYSALAGRKARAPKDLSFLSDPKARDEFDKRERDGKLRRDTKRNEVPIEQRRAELIEMLPKEQQEKVEDIAAEVNEKRQKKEIAHGKIIPPKKKGKYADPEDEALLRKINIDDPTEDFRRRVLGSENREDELPDQDGMEISMTDRPQFYSETRHWSRIESDNPTWSEIQQNTEIVIPQPKGNTSVNEGRFVPDDKYDPENRYQQQEGVKPREMPQQREGEHYEPIAVNPYAADTVLSPEEIKKILGDDIRRPGELTLPDDVTDPGLRSVWNGTYGMRYRKPDEPQFVDDFNDVPRAQKVIGVRQKKQKHTVSPARHRGQPRPRPEPQQPQSEQPSPFTMGYEAGQMGALDAEKEELERQRSDLARQREQLRRVLEEHEERKAQQEEDRRIREETRRRLEDEKRRRDEERFRREEMERARRDSRHAPQDDDRRVRPPYPPYPPPYPGQRPDERGKNQGRPPYGEMPRTAQPPFPWGPPPAPAAPQDRGVPTPSRTGGRTARRG